MNPDGGTPDTQATPKPAPVMDVVPPQPPHDPYIQVAEPTTPSEPMAEPPDAVGQSSEPADESPDKLIEQEAHDVAKTEVPAATKSAKSSKVGLAIAATVIIVLALAALATYAYMQTNK